MLKTVVQSLVTYNIIKRLPTYATGVTRMIIKSTAVAAHLNGTRFIIKIVMILAVIQTPLIKVGTALECLAIGVTTMPRPMTGVAIWTHQI